MASNSSLVSLHRQAQIYGDSLQSRKSTLSTSPWQKFLLQDSPKNYSKTFYVPMEAKFLLVMEEEAMEMKDMT
jgi:hypothetical protein